MSSSEKVLCPLTNVLTLIGFVLGGKIGKRLVVYIDVVTSLDTRLWLIRKHPESQRPTPRMLRVNGFSFYKAQNLRHYTHWSGGTRARRSAPNSLKVRTIHLISSAVSH